MRKKRNWPLEREETNSCQRLYIVFFFLYSVSFVVVPSDRFYVDVSCTKDRRFITVNSNSKSTSEVIISAQDVKYWTSDRERPTNC